jgi:hypothetical protein
MDASLSGAAPTTSFCPGCGAASTGARYCAGCGRDLMSSIVSPAVAPRMALPSAPALPHGLPRAGRSKRRIAAYGLGVFLAPAGMGSIAQSMKTPPTSPAASAPVAVAAISTPTMTVPPTMTPEPTVQPTPEPTVEPTPDPTPEATAEPTPAPTPKPTPQLTLEQENAIGTAGDYLDYSAFSRSGLIGQLKYEGYSTAVATFAVDHVTVNWNEQAYLSAKAYLDYTHFSRSGLIGQLKYEGFTTKQATYGVTKAGL